MRTTLAAILVVALTAAACSSTEDEEVATVGEVPISLSMVTALVEVEDTMAIDETFRDVLFRVVAMEALEQQLDAEFGTALDEAAVEAQHQEFMAEITEAGMDPATATQIPIAGEGMIRFNARLVVLRDAVVQTLAADPEVVQTLLDDAVSVTSVCVRHVLVETEEEILDVQERLEAGEDFATVADEVSVDTASPGGDLGCAPAARYVEPFATTSVEAPLGELAGPIETEFGYHLLIVDERTVPTAEEITSDPAAFLTDAAASDLWSDWFNETLRTASIEVNPRYGRWSEVGLGITAPEEE